MLEIFKSAAHKTRDRIMAYEPLGSEPKERGARSRIVKQSQSRGTGKTLEVKGDEEKVLDYIQHNHASHISYRMISLGSGVAYSRVGRAVEKLVRKGAIEKLVTRPRHGTLYQIIGGSPNPSKVTAEPSIPTGKEEDDIDFVKITNDLVWAFIRETRSTDVLLYLTWLERKGSDSA